MDNTDMDNTDMDNTDIDNTNIDSDVKNFAIKAEINDEILTDFKVLNNNQLEKDAMHRDLTNSRRSSAPAAASMDAKSERHSAVTKTVVIRRAAERSAEYGAVTSYVVNYLTQHAITNALRRVARGTSSVKAMLARRADTSDIVVSSRVADIPTNLEVPAKNFQKKVTAKSLLIASRLNAQRLEAVAERNSEINDEILIDFKVLNDIKLEKDTTHRDLTAQAAASVDAQLAKQTADTKTVAIRRAAERLAVYGAVTSDVVASPRVADIPTNLEVPNYLTQCELTNARRRMASSTASVKAKLAISHVMFTRLHGNVEGVAREEVEVETSQRITAKKLTVASILNAQRLADTVSAKKNCEINDEIPIDFKVLNDIKLEKDASHRDLTARVAASVDAQLAKQTADTKTVAIRIAAEKSAVYSAATSDVVVSRRVADIPTNSEVPNYLTQRAREKRKVETSQRVTAKSLLEASRLNAQRLAAVAERNSEIKDEIPIDFKVLNNIKLEKDATHRDLTARVAASMDSQLTKQTADTKTVAVRRAAEKSAVHGAVTSDVVVSRRVADIPTNSEVPNYLTQRELTNARRRLARSTASVKAKLALSRVMFTRLHENLEVVAGEEGKLVTSQRITAKRSTVASILNVQRLTGVAYQYAARRLAKTSKSRGRQLAVYARNPRAARVAGSTDDVLARRAMNVQRTAAKRAAETPEARVTRLAAIRSQLAVFARNRRAARAKKRAAELSKFRADLSAAQRSLVSHLHAAYGLSSDMQGDLTTDHLQHFKHDPMVALLAIATDIGIAYVSQQDIASAVKDVETEDEIGKDKVRMSNGGEHALLSSNNGDRQCSGDNSNDVGHMELTFDAASTINLNDSSEFQPQDLSDLDASLFDFASSAARQYRVGFSIIIR